MWLSLFKYGLFNNWHFIHTEHLKGYWIREIGGSMNETKTANHSKNEAQCAKTEGKINGLYHKFNYLLDIYANGVYIIHCITGYT